MVSKLTLIMAMQAVSERQVHVHVASSLSYFQFWLTTQCLNELTSNCRPIYPFLSYPTTRVTPMCSSHAGPKATSNIAQFPTEDWGIFCPRCCNAAHSRH
jgi:hypothetical protein